PVEAIARQRKDVALLVSGQEEDQCFIGTEQLLHFLRLERLWARERGIVGKLGCQTRRVGGKRALSVDNLLADRLDQRRVALTFRLRQRLDQRLVALTPEGGEVL